MPVWPSNRWVSSCRSVNDHAALESLSLITTNGATVVCDGETAKHLHVDGRVMAAQIPLEQDEYAGTLCSRAEQSERLVGRRLRVVGGGVQVMSEHFAQSLRR